jgi:hypothetical protein
LKKQERNMADGEFLDEDDEEIEDGPNRFHIAEWYGRPFLELSDGERLELANFKAKGSMPKANMKRLLDLRAKNPRTAKEEARLAKLEQDYLDLTQTRKVCPFRTDSPFPLCTKAGGVCSIRLVEEVGGRVQPVVGERAPIRATCPYRFQEGNRVFQAIGNELLGDPEPYQVGEVGFLESTGNLDSAPGQDVGRIDMVLVKTNAPEGHPLDWVAAEIQAVYFSGDEMPMEFKQLRENGGKLTMPAGKRRPDYRSSGPKRLMPQLQIKVPTLRRWGRKMVCIVDTPFYDSMGEMEEVEDISNGDIVWYLVDFVAGDTGDPYQLTVGRKATVTLERAIEGLTGGNPVAKSVFERRIKKKMDGA